MYAPSCGFAALNELLRTPYEKQFFTLFLTYSSTSHRTTIASDGLAAAWANTSGKFFFHKLFETLFCHLPVKS